MSEEIKTAYLILEKSPRSRRSRRVTTAIGNIPLSEGMSPTGTYRLDDGNFLEVTALDSIYAGRDVYRRGLQLKVVEGIASTDTTVLFYPQKLREGIFVQTGARAPGIARLSRNTWLRMTL